MPRRCKLRLTKRSVDALPVGPKDTVFCDRDLAGFGLPSKRAGAVDTDISMHVNVSKEVAQRRSQHLRVATAETLGMAQDELISILGGQRLQRDGPRSEALSEEGANDGKI